MIPPFAFAQPATMGEALDLLARHAEGASVLAGGTNLLVDLRRGSGRPTLVVDIERIPELQGVRRADGCLLFGPLVTYRQLLEEMDGPAALAQLQDSAITVGGPPIRNRGTVGGNIVDGSPAADIIPPFMALDADLILASRSGRRRVPIREFFLGPRRTVRRPDELLAGIAVREAALGERCGSTFHKFGNRDADAIAVVSAAVWIRLRDGGIEDLRVSLGAVAPTVVRAPSVEGRLIGQPLDPRLVAEAAHEVVRDIRPISDIRATAAYRFAIGRVLVRRAILEAAARAEGQAPWRGWGDEGRAPMAQGGPPREGERQSGAEVRFVLNGRAARMTPEPHETLLRALRERLGLLAAKEGCGQGDCGACTVLVDGGPANACLVLARQVEGRRVETVEGLGSREALHLLQEAYVAQGAIQCGFCTPGLLMSSKALLDRNPRPTEFEIRAALSGNLCRCTGYTKIVRAVRAAAEALAR